MNEFNENVLLKRESNFKIMKALKVVSAEKMDKKVKITTNEGEYYTNKSLQQVEQDLDDRFLRIHNSTVINLLRVDEYLSEENQVIMDNGVIYKVAKRRTKNALRHGGHKLPSPTYITIIDRPAKDTQVTGQA